MNSPQLAPQTLGDIIAMAVAPVFLISSLIAYLGADSYTHLTLPTIYSV